MEAKVVAKAQRKSPKAARMRDRWTLESEGQGDPDAEIDHVAQDKENPVQVWGLVDIEDIGGHHPVASGNRGLPVHPDPGNKRRITGQQAEDDQGKEDQGQIREGPDSVLHLPPDNDRPAGIEEPPDHDQEEHSDEDRKPEGNPDQPTEKGPGRIPLGSEKEADGRKGDKHQAGNQELRGPLVRAAGRTGCA